MSDAERITSVVPVSEFAGDQFLVMLTANGYIKKVSLSSFSSIRSTGIIAIQLVCTVFLIYHWLLDCIYCYFSAYTLTEQVPGDELKWVRRCTNDDLVAMASQNGMVTLSACENVSYIEEFLVSIHELRCSLNLN